MRQDFGTISLIVFVFAASLGAGFVLFLTSSQSERPYFEPTVDVAATAQAVQAHNQRIELETAIERQRATWETEIAKKQQALTQFDGQAQKQISELQTQLLDLQAQIQQANISIQALRQELTELKQAKQDDEAELADLKSAVAQVESDLAMTNGQLQAAYNELARRQATTRGQPSFDTASSEDAGGTQKGDLRPDGGDEVKNDHEDEHKADEEHNKDDGDEAKSDHEDEREADEERDRDGDD